MPLVVRSVGGRAQLAGGVVEVEELANRHGTPAGGGDVLPFARERRWVDGQTLVRAKHGDLILPARPSQGSERLRQRSGDRGGDGVCVAPSKTAP